MPVCPAWLLEFGHAQRAALGLREVVHVLADLPELFRVPRAHAACRSVFLWRDRIAPLVDLAVVTVGTRSNPDTSKLLVVAFQDTADGDVRHGGLLLRRVPERIFVDDQHALEPSGLPPSWTPFARAGYQEPDGPVPILDLARIFSPRLAAAETPD